MTNAVAAIATANWRTSSGVPATPRIIWKIGQWNRYIPYDRVPIQSSSGHAEESAGERAAMRHGGDHQHGRQVDGEEAAAEQQRIGALVGDDVQPPRQHQQRADADEGRGTSRVAPLLRSGPRITATGRHSIASAAPTSRPVDRVIVDRYSVSVLAMACPPTSQ